VTAALHYPAHQASFAVLAVAVGTVPTAALLGGGAASTVPVSRKAISLAVECTGYGTALVALALCAPYPGTLWLALALCAVSAAGVALRADRRPGAGYGSAVLLVLATWVRLFASGISSPEAYTLPVSGALLLIGWLRRRRPGSGETAAPTRVSSWWAYGGGLAFTFVPSLAMVWGDPHWLRPLLLGAGALGATLAGARWRLQAPLLLGGATLVAVGVHELGPYVAQVAGLLPRWLTIALAGLLLVVAGATYERRLEEARRLKRAWQQLS
ncbi:SCO7613 C-terminal domain-containing membrane protein, partial [Streptomyces albidus (ex Kaewkla and Franco 2022)]|uniref:SCO7613 C-terminal domain-containing membrane protein n=1 Tax=Streptomyces albidus (ex Kaewkla and Franco 2022) TaxID=722709 RepID=UPI003AF31966